MTARLTLSDINLTMGSFRLTLDLDVQLGSLGVFGPSGSGKTTLLELIAGLRHQHTGQVVLDGNLLAESSRKIRVPVHRRRIGYVPQDLALFSHLSVKENIVYGTTKREEDAPQAEPDVEAICEILELTSLLSRRPITLSGGEKQRVALARALAAGPRLLLLDEPLTGLDQDRKDAVLNYLQLLRQRWPVPMIYVSHQAEELVELCDEIIVLCEGGIRGRGRPSEVFEVSNRPAYSIRAPFGTMVKKGDIALTMSPMPPTPVRVLFLGPLRDQIGQGSVEIPFPPDGTQSLFWVTLQEQFPLLKASRGTLRLARDNDFLEASTVLLPGDEVALIPPVSGG